MEMARSHIQETHEGENAAEVLKHEHRIIERVLAVMERLAEKPGIGSKEVWEKAIDFIRNFADKCHHLKEEQILFPALEEHGIPREGGPVGMMLLEHEAGDDGRLLGMQANSVIYVPGHTAHRTVNIGAAPLVYLGIYPAKAGHDYATIAADNFRHMIVERDGRPCMLRRPR